MEMRVNARRIIPTSTYNDSYVHVDLYAYIYIHTRLSSFQVVEHIWYNSGRLFVDHPFLHSDPHSERKIWSVKPSARIFQVACGACAEGCPYPLEIKAVDNFPFIDDFPFETSISSGISQLATFEYWRVGPQVLTSTSLRHLDPPK